MQLKITRTIRSTVSSQYYLACFLQKQVLCVAKVLYVLCTSYKEQTNIPEKEVGNETPSDKQELRLPGSRVCSSFVKI